MELQLWWSCQFSFLSPHLLLLKEVNWAASPLSLSHCYCSIYCLLTCFNRSFLHQLPWPPPGGVFPVLWTLTASIRESPILSKGVGVEKFSFLPLTVQKNQCEFYLQLKSVSNETSFSCEHISLILEPLKLDLNIRWVPPSTCRSTFLRAIVSLSVTSESSNGSISCSVRSSQTLYQEMNCFYV
jgi:hypothetical protein